MVVLYMELWGYAQNFWIVEDLRKFHIWHTVFL